MYSGQVLRGAVGRPIPDLLETLRQEYENMGQEISVFKAQRDEYERKRRPPSPPPSPARRTAPPTAPPPAPARAASTRRPGSRPVPSSLGARRRHKRRPARRRYGRAVPASAVCEGWGFGRRCPIRMHCKWGGRCIVFGVPAAGCSTPCSGCGRSDRLRLGGSGGAAAGNDRDERDA